MIHNRQQRWQEFTCWWVQNLDYYVTSLTDTTVNIPSDQGVIVYRFCYQQYTVLLSCLQKSSEQLVNQFSTKIIPKENSLIFFSYTVHGMSNTSAVDLWNCEYCPICYVHQRHKTLSGEIYNIWSLSENIHFFVGALETCRKENLWPVF